VVTPTITTITIHRNSKGNLAVTITPLGGASGVVEMGLAANAAPNGITVTATSGMLPAPGSGTTTFTFNVSSTAALGTYQLDAVANMLVNSTSTAPFCVGWSSSPVTLNIVQ
jgi:hypothetical protein